MRFILTFVLAAYGAAAAALCDGQSFFHRLSEDQMSELLTVSDATPYGEGLLWRAKRGENEIIVIGTMHIYDTRLKPIFDRIKDEIATADVLLVEATSKEEAAMQATIAENPDMIFITEGATLPERLDEELWQSLADASRARQVPPFLAAKMQPWYLSLTLSIPPCALSDIATGLRGLDHMIMDEAAAHNIPMTALEPYTTLLEIMNKGTFEEQIEMLQLTLLAPELHSEMFVAMLDSYFEEEIAMVWEATRLATAFVPGLDIEHANAIFSETEQAILIDRNLSWMPVINENLGPKTIVAAGAAHLIGEQGILRLLEKEGWAITPY